MLQGNSLRRSRNRRYVLLGGGLISAAMAYKIYTSDSIGHGKRYFNRLRVVLQRYVDVLATGGEICTSILQDLQTFLHSDGDEVPHSLRQLAKLLQSPEVAATTTSTVSAVYRGIAGPSSQAQIESTSSGPPQPAALDKILDAILSDRGHSLVSVAVSMASKNLMSAYLETSNRLSTTTTMIAQQRQTAAGGASTSDNQGVYIQQQQPQDTTDKLLDFFSSQSGQHLAVLCVAAFASNGMRVYMDKSLEVNLYEDLFTSMSKPAHLDAVKQCVGVFARDIVGAYLQGGNPVAALGAQAAVAALPPAPQLTALHDNEDEDNGGDVRSKLDNVASSSRASQGSEAADVAPAVEEEGLLSPTTRANGQHTYNDITNDTSTTTSSSPPEHRIPAAWTRHDDLDSDGLLHEQGTLNRQRTRQQLQLPQQQQRRHRLEAKNSQQTNSNAQWVSAVGKEWLNVVKDPTGRDVMVSLVGSATREVVQGVTGAASERMTMVLFMFVLFLGGITAWLIQMMLRTTASALGIV